MCQTNKLEDQLHVVTAISNPVRYATRYRLYQEFAHRVSHAGATLWTIEVATGERPFGITEAGNPHHIQIRSKHELWHKENMLNLAINRMPEHVKYIAWVDADVQFVRPDWAGETVHQLQHYHFIQMFDHAIDLGPKFEPICTHKGWVYSYMHKMLTGHCYTYPGKAHPGYAWAARRSALDKVGGLIDHAILGAADTHMAMALIGRLSEGLNKRLHPNYKKWCQIWEDRCEKHIRRNVGYMPGLLMHYWHGKKSDRQYRDRWNILTDCRYDPEADLKRDAQGLWQLTDRSIQLRDQIREYFRQRNEDSIDP